MFCWVVIFAYMLPRVFFSQPLNVDWWFDSRQLGHFQEDVGNTKGN